VTPIFLAEVELNLLQLAGYRARHRFQMSIYKVIHMRVSTAVPEWVQFCQPLYLKRLVVGFTLLDAKRQFTMVPTVELLLNAMGRNTFGQFGLAC